MAPPSESRLEELFLAALELPETERDAWLVKQCAGAEEGETLLAAARALLRSDARNRDGLLQFAAAPGEQTPLTIGIYTVHAALPLGGMGAVFDCVHEPTGRHAAVKLIRTGLSTEKRRVRMALEAEVLGRLNHEGIAHLYDAGVADVTYPDGARIAKPFIAMEFVAGLSVVRYCTDVALPLRQRVELMVRIARAVQHAHEKGIIHRDLKPANIIVAPGGVPKVVDFGIARLVTRASHLTLSGMILGTPSYMSPEQLAGQQDQIDTRTDVYGLGAVLYEMLGGRPPIESPSALTPTALMALIQAQPSRLAALQPGLPRELDAIVHKALERKPADRYASAGAFADDLERWLNHEPIIARPPGPGRRLAMLCRRRPRLMVGVSVAAVALLTLGSLAVWQAVRATRAEKDVLKHLAEVTSEKARADQETRIAAAVAAFLTDDVIRQADVHEQDTTGTGYDIRLSAALDRAAERLGDRFKDQPAVEAAIRMTIGHAYGGIGKHDQAVEQYRRAQGLFEHLQPSSTGPTRDSLNARGSLALALSASGNPQDAAILAEAALHDARATLGPQDHTTIGILANLALILDDRGDYALAVTRGQEAAALSAKALGPDDPLTLITRNNLANALADAGQLDASIAEYTAVLEINRRVFGAENPNTLGTISNLAAAYLKAGDFQKAADLLEPAVTAARKHLGPDHPKTLIFLSNLGQAYMELQDPDKAAPCFQEAAAIRHRTLGPDHPDTITGLQNLAALQWALGEKDEAGRLLTSVSEARRRALGPDNPETLFADANLAEFYRRVERYDDAKKLGEDTVARLSATLGDDHPQTLSVRFMLANLMMDMGQVTEAETAYRLGAQRAASALGPASRTTTAYLNGLALCLDRQGKPEEADKVRASIKSK